MRGKGRLFDPGSDQTFCDLFNSGSEEIVGKPKACRCPSLDLPTENSIPEHFILYVDLALSFSIFY